MTNVKLTFGDLTAGTVVDDQFEAQGVTISSIVDGDVNDDETPAMGFDTSNPTGDDDQAAATGCEVHGHATRTQDGRG